MKRITTLLLVVNVVVLASFLFLWIIPSVRLYLSDKHDSAEIGMKPYLKRKPFTLLVDQEFPATSSFMLGVEGIPVVFKYQPDDDLVTAKICVGLNDEVAISFSDFKSPSIRQVTLINNGTVYQDVGGNGTYDKTLSLTGNAEATQ